MLALKRGIESAGAVAFGARSAQAAVDRMEAGEHFDAVLLPWSLVGCGAYEIVWRLERAGLRSPFLMAFERTWQHGDAARALQLGYDAFFGIPVSARDVCQELVQLRDGFVSASRRHLVELGGEDLLRQSARLWNVTEDPAWRRRMAALASRASKRQAQRSDRVERVLEALDETAGRTIDGRLADAVRRICEGESAWAVAELIGFGEHLLERLYRTAYTALSPGGSPPAEEFELMEQVVERARARDMESTSSHAFAELCGLASDMLTGADPGPFVERLSHMLKLRSGPIARLPEDRLREIASHLVAAVHERDAIAHARLIVMSDLLSRARANGALGSGDLETLGVLLECDDPYAVGAAPRLIMAASRDETGRCELTGAPLQLVGGAMKALVQATPEQRGSMRNLAERLKSVVGATEPGGEVERRRLEFALDMAERHDCDRDELLSDTALGALEGALRAPPGRRHAAGAALVTTLGVHSPEQGARLARFIDGSPCALSMGDVFDAADASNTQAGLLDYRTSLSTRAETARRLDLVEGATAQAYFARACADLGVAACAPTSAELGRVIQCDEPDLGAVRLVLEHTTSPRERRQAVERFVDRNGDRPEVLHALLEDSDDDPALAAAVRDRLGLPEGTLGHPDVLELVRAGNVRAAMVAAQTLPEKHPRTVAVLNKIALEIEHQGDPEGAVEVYERALALQPNRLNTQLNLARLLIRLERHHDARPLLERIRDVAPGFGDSETLWGELALAS